MTQAAKAVVTLEVPSSRHIQVIRLMQRDVPVFIGAITADELLEIGRVERFGESSDGVNRLFDERHAMRIAAAMLEEGTLMLDDVCGDLKGPWEYREGGLLVALSPDSFLSIDDGQHRRGACEVLNPEERARWSWPFVATQGLDYETRMRIFRQQRMRKHIDSRLDLAQRHRLGEWGSDAEREAYNLILKLNSDPNSPLRGMILLEETVRRPYEHRHRTEGINAAGLWSTLRSVMGKGSPLNALSLDKRSEVALNLIFLASEIWAKAWRSKDHILTTARGINAVLKLIVSGANFRVVIGDDFRVESLRAALELAAKFNWTVKAHKNAGRDEITLSIDAMIGRSHQRKLETGGGEILA